VLDPQYLWLFGLLIGLGAFTQGFTGIGFGIIVLAGIAFTPWDFERATVVLNLLVLVLNGSIICLFPAAGPEAGQKHVADRVYQRHHFASGKHYSVRQGNHPAGHEDRGHDAADSRGVRFAGARRQPACFQRHVFENRIQLYPFSRPTEYSKRPAVTARFYAAI
jgi:hypothetical protein